MIPGIMQHPDAEVDQAITKLSDALCMWERATGRQSILIIREQGGFVYRAMSGKPNMPDETTDAEMLSMVTE